jgi:serine phosphatase RsbU (regulator of sigma subunit)
MTLKYFYQFLVFLFFLVLSSSDEERITLSYDSLKDVNSILLNDGWKFSPVEDSSWTESDYNDSTWIIADPHVYPDSRIKKDWKGIGWFRLKFNIDSTLYSKALRLAFYSAGDIQFYHNGNLIHKLYPNKEKNYENLQNVTIVFNSKKRQVFAVKFSNDNVEEFNDAGIMAGFELYIGLVDKYTAASYRYSSRIISFQMFFLGLTLAFCLLHFILFIFYREAKSNLYFTIFLLLYAFSTYFDYAHSIYSTVENFLFNIRAHRLLVALTLIAVVRLVFSLFHKRLNIAYWIFVLAVTVVSVFVYLKPTQNFQYLEFINFYGFAIMFYIFVTALKEKQPYVWLIATGFLLVFIFSLYDFFMDLGLITPIFEITNGYPFGLVGLFICISIYLSKDIANRNKLILEQDRIVKEKELNEIILQKENDRKKFELEEARKIQLSMLPSCLNNFPGYDICFDMRTATEVGGDYYDFSEGKNGTLNIIIGDATGHGMKAGLMVATFKSLFSTLGKELEITEFLKRANDIVKNMNLGNLFMSMSFIRLIKGQFEISNAGMPPCLHYRKKTNDIERIILKSMPLGAPLSISYKSENRNIESGDIILLLSDGLEELFNEEMEMLGNDKIMETIVSNSDASANQIATELFSLGDKWRGEKQQDDDITFVVIKIK